MTRDNIRGNYVKSRRLSWYRKEVRDPYEPQYYTAVTCSIYAPTMAIPYPTVLISIANAAGRTLLRAATLEAAQEIVYLPPEALERLRPAMEKANELADEIEQDMKVLFQRRRLPEGMKQAYYDCKSKNSIDADTGEILKESGPVYKA